MAWSDGAEAAKKRAKPHAGDQVAEAPTPPAVYGWSGFYIGMNAGVAWGQFDPMTSTVKGGSITLAGPVSLLNAAGRQTA